MKHVFVWTLKDLTSLGFLGFMVLMFVIGFVYESFKKRR